MAALWIVRQFPRQILRDLDRFHSRKIADWWRGTRNASGDLILSSYELLAYLEFMDEEGAFKTAAERGGRWPGWKQMLAEAVNEAYRFRASYHMVNGGVEAGFDPSDYEFVDPAMQADIDRQTAIDMDAASAAQAQFNAAIGFS